MIKRIIFTIFLSSLFCVTIGFLIIFEGKTSLINEWWADFTRNNESIPLSPFNSRKVDSSKLIIHDAHQIKFSDKRLFWRGENAVGKPLLNSKGKLKEIIIINEGRGYSTDVEARVLGGISDEFDLTDVETHKGKITKVKVSSAGEWISEPLAFVAGEKDPYSGKIETRHLNGQILKEESYLNGRLHGITKKFDVSGIPIFEKEFRGGMKSGTHIYWFQSPLDPSDYEPKVGKDGDLMPNLWLYLHDQAKTKFADEYPSEKTSQWVLNNYKLKGGSFQVKQLEHWKDNLKHGLWEGFDEFGNKTFKDEYKLGLRTKHKTFDKSS